MIVIVDSLIVLAAALGRRNGMITLEEDVLTLESSSIFTKYPSSPLRRGQLGRDADINQERRDLLTTRDGLTAIDLEKQLQRGFKADHALAPDDSKV